MLDQKEKKYIYIAFALIAILLLIVLYIIWSPMFESKSVAENIRIYSTKTEEEYIKETVEDYKLKVMNYIDKENYESLSSKLNNDYLTKNGLTIDTAKDYLVNNNIIKYSSNSMVVYNSSVKTDGKAYVYTYVYKINNDEKKVHIIEDYYRNYTVSFEQEEYPIINKKGYQVDINGLKFEIKVVSSYENSVVYNVTLTNSTTDEYNIYLNSINDVEAELYNLEIYKLDAVVVGNSTSEIKSVPGASITFNISLEIPLEKQCDLMNIKLNNVLKNNNEKVTLNLDLE